MNAEETIRARLLGFGMQIPELLTQRMFVFSNAHKPPKTVAPTVLILELKCIVLINTYRLTQKKVCHAPSKSRKYERGYLGNYQG